MGSFALRGFRQPEELFARSLVKVDSDEYLKPLADVVNEEGPRVQGYRFVGRKLTTEFVREFGTGKVRPFLARELLNVPKLPYSPRGLDEVARGAVNDKEKEREFYGYFVEWEGNFESFTRHDSEIILHLQIGGDLYSILWLHLPLSYLELVKVLEKGQRLRARGVIDNIGSHIISLNYVDIEIVAESAGA